MSENPQSQSEWMVFVHREDASIRYEARLSNGKYEIRRPGEVRIMTKIPQERFESLYVLENEVMPPEEQVPSG